MTRLRVRRRAGWSSVFLLAALLAAGTVLLTAGPAGASGTVTCPPDNGTDVQNAINGGGTVTINGTCHGNFDVATSVTIQGGSPGATLNGDANGPVLTIHNGAFVTIRNLIITNGASCFGGGLDIYQNGTTVNLFNTTVTGNSSCDEGGGIAMEDFSTLNLTASKVTNNTAAFQGGGIAAFCCARVTLTNSTVSGNTAGTNGGGIAVDDTYLAMTGTTVDHNTATNDFGEDAHGGGVYVDFSVMYATASTFASNRSSSFDFGEPSGDAGGIRGLSSNIELVASRVLGNLANDDGGGILFQDQCGQFCLETAPINRAVNKAFPNPFDVPVGLTLDGTTVDHNQAVSGSGGGIANDAVGNDSPVTLMNSTVSNNVTLDTSTFGESGGAGISQHTEEGNTASLTTANVNIFGNRSGSVGGGIANFGFGGVATVSTGQTTNFQSPNALQVGNQAKFGGGVYNAGLDASVSLNAGTKMARNKATINGGGVFNDCGGSLFVAPGVVLLANYPNNVFTNVGGCILP